MWIIENPDRAVHNPSNHKPSTIFSRGGLLFLDAAMGGFPMLYHSPQFLFSGPPPA